MKKKILLVLAAVILIMSVCVVASADVQSVTYDAKTHPGVSVSGNGGSEKNTIEYLTERGLSNGATAVFPTDVPEGEYIVTASVSTNLDGHKIQAYIEKSAGLDFTMPFQEGKIAVPNIGWQKFSDMTLGVAKITAERKRIGLNILLLKQDDNNPVETYVLIKSITLTPVVKSAKIVTYNGTAAMLKEVSNGTNLKFITDVEPGKYYIIAKMAADKGQTPLFDCYIDDSTPAWAVASRIYKDVHVPNKGSEIFEDFLVGLGTVELTETKNCIYFAMTKGIARFASITLVPAENVVTYNYADDGDIISVTGAGGSVTDQQLYNGLKQGTIWYDTKVTPGKYLISAQLATNSDDFKVDTYLSPTGQSIFTSPILKNIDVLNYGWSGFSEQIIGVADITETYKKIGITITLNKETSNVFVRNQKLTLIPIYGILPDVNVMSGDKDITHTGLVSGDITVRANFNVINNTRDYVVVAAYYENDVMKEAKIAQDSQTDIGEYSATLSNVVKGENNYVKVFLWNNLTDVFPYGEEIVVK